MKKNLILAIFFGSLLFFAVNHSFADENNTAPAPTPVNTDMVSVKLDKILANQDLILKQLDEMKAELQIVKIRASQR